MEDKMNQSKPKDHIKYKFIRRTLQMDKSHSAVIYTKMKRIYFRKVSVFSEKFRKWYFHLTRKQLNCLTDLETTLSFSLHDKKLLKNLKNLKNISILFWSENPIGSLIQNIKQLPKNIETITVSGNIIVTDPAEIGSLYRNLTNFRKLKRFEKNLSFVEEDREPRNLTEIEYNFINKHIPRLSNLKELSCEELGYGEQGLRRFMSHDRECRLVTGLTLPMVEYMLSPDISLASLFRFQVFPRLSRLNISIRGTWISLDSSIIEGLKSLNQLKKFTLDIRDRFEGVKFFFEVLSHLPLLDLFHLSMPIENNEELLLIEFLQRQTQLISLTLFSRSFVSSRERYEQQNRNLEIICQSLSDMSRLKYLHMEGYYWSLISLSRGLSHVGLSNQLKEVRVQVFDDISLSASPDNKVKGLCDFIERQQLSLCSLSMTIDCVKEDEIIDNLINAVGKADQIKSLYFCVNIPYSNSSIRNNQLLQDIPRESLKEYPSFNHTFASLNKVLPRLKKLSILNLYLSTLLFTFDDRIINSSVIFNSLGSLKQLKSLSLCLPSLRESLITHQVRVLEQLSRMDALTMCIFTDSNESHNSIEEIAEALGKTEQQRNFRQSLAF